MDNKLKVLSLEDSPQDVEFIRELLIDSGYILIMDCTEKKGEFAEFLRSCEYDVILSDFKLPGFDAFAALKIVNEICPDTPFICVSGTVGEEIAVELLKEGAVDYVLKDRLVRLPSAIQRAINEVKEKRARKIAEAKVKETQVLLQAVIESTKDMEILSVNMYYEYLTFNTFHKEFMKSTYGVDINIGINQLDCIANDEDRLRTKSNYNRAFTGISFITIEEHESKNGQYFEKRYNPIYNEIDEVVGVTVFSANITEQKLIEKALKEAELHYRSLAENSPDLITRYDRQYRHLYVNPSAIKAGRYSSGEDYLGKTVREVFIPKEGATKWERNIQFVFETGMSIEFDDSFSSPNSKRHLNTKFVPERDSNGKILSVLSISRDITERYRIEEALKASEQIFNSFMEYSPIYIFFKDHNGKPIRLSKNFEQLLQTPLEEAIGKSMYELFPSEMAKKMIEDDFNVIKSGKPIKLIEQLNDRFYESTKFPIELKDQPALLAGFTVDITEQKAVEFKIQKLNEELELKVAERTTQLQETLTLIENIMLSTTVGFSVYNAKGDCILVNDAMANIIGGTKDELLKQNQHHIESWRKTGLYEISISSISEQIPNSKEVFIKTSFGKETWIDCRFTPFIANNKHNLLLTVSEISERVRREQEIQELNEELQVNIERLELVNKELEAFSYSVSHDLRAPLRAIHGFLSILEENLNEKVDDEGIRLMSIVKDNALRMGLLIDELLAFSKINRVDIKKTNIDFNSLIDYAFLENSTPEQREKIKLSVAKLPNIKGDSNLFQHVWSNLLSNAIKYTSKTQDPVIEIGFTELQDAYEFFIKDNGAGFEMNYADKLFGVFQRLHSDKEFEGIGVGLAIVKRIVNRHGGRVWAEGEVGKGSKFYFTVKKNEKSTVG